MRGIIHVLDNSEDRYAARYALEAALIQHAAGLAVTLAGPIADQAARRRAERDGIALTDLEPASKAGVRSLAALASPGEVLIAHSPPAAHAARQAAKASGADYVGVVHHPYPLTGLLNRRRTAALTSGRLTVTVSAALSEHVRAAGVADGRIRLLRPAVNSAHFGPGTVTGARVVALADQWRLSDGAPMVLVPGLTASQPQVRLLFRALESLAIPDLHCLILPPVQAGKEHAAALADQADRAGVGHIIHAVALCNDLPAAYMLADAVVTLPPWDVGFDWTAAEAQALGRPVVGPDSASLRELTVPGRTAWLAEDDKPATLAAALTRALALRGPDREALAEAAQDNIARVCDRRRFASGLAGLARDLSEGQLAGMEELADAEADSA